MNLYPWLILMKLPALEYLTLRAENMNEIGLIVFEIWPGKVKSRGRVYSSRHVYWAEYGTCIHSPFTNCRMGDFLC